MMLLCFICLREWSIKKKNRKKIKFLVGIQFFLFKFALYKNQNIMPCLILQTEKVATALAIRRIKGQAAW